MARPAENQLALHLPLRPAFDRGHFVVGRSNAEALAWIDNWPRWPGAGLVIHGPAGSGKTHLAHLWCQASAATLIEARMLSRRIGPEFLGKPDAIAVDGIDRLDDEETLFHAINAISQAGASLLVTSRTPPGAWSFASPDLASRLRALSAVRLDPPDDDLLASVLRKQFQDRQLMVSPPVIRYLVRHMERAFSAARRIVDLIDRRSFKDRRRVTVPLAKACLAALERGGEPAGESGALRR